MFGIGYFKGLPTEYVIRYSGGREVAQGAGLSFWYVAYKTSIALLPRASSDADFVFNELTANYQSVTIQGQFTYRIGDPKQAAELVDFGINPRTRRYVTDQPDRLPRQISNLIQTETRDEVRKRTLEAVLNEAPAIATGVLARIQEKGLAGVVGAELLHLHFLSVKPEPEVARALEADYQQEVLRRADEAMYARRAAAVEKERKIKENELSTDIALEEQRERLVAKQGLNALQEAEHRGKALELEAEYRARAAALELSAFEQVEPAKILSLTVRELGSKLDGLLSLLARPKQEQGQ